MTYKCVLNVINSKMFMFMLVLNVIQRSVLYVIKTKRKMLVMFALNAIQINVLDRDVINSKMFVNVIN